MIKYVNIRIFVVTFMRVNLIYEIIMMFYNRIFLAARDIVGV